MKEKYYYFTLIITQPNFDDERTANKLFEAGCDDATFCFMSGRYELTFSRQAPSFHQAIMSAVNDLSKSGVGSYVVHIIEEKCDECDGKSTTPS